ncbi:MAG: nitrate reductase molybdenum cofactor assembly chaperone [Desulfovibrio sp.]|nr:nitrate reductase molybdenum cofactor assembly chaperone [Desulfovibrio sp.]
MTENERTTLVRISRLLDYPGPEFFAAIPEMRADIRANVEGEEAGVLAAFLDALEELGPRGAQEAYVRVFDHDPSASLYLAWHRYGNDRSQGRAMAALNGLYRMAGFEPLPGSFPDYLPRVLEFLSVCEDWAAEALLDGFGPELAALEKRVAELGSAQAPLLRLALKGPRRDWPERFKARTHDATRRPLARPEPEFSPATHPAMAPGGFGESTLKGA